MFTLIKKPVIRNNAGLNRSTIVKADTVLVDIRVGGDLTTATIKFTGRLRDDPLKTVVIQKSSNTASEILIEPTGGTLFSDVVLHLASSDTSVLDPDTWIEYDIQIEDAIFYGGTTGTDVTINPATMTVDLGQFKVIDQITV